MVTSVTGRQMDNHEILLYEHQYEIFQLPFNESCFFRTDVGLISQGNDQKPNVDTIHLYLYALL